MTSTARPLAIPAYAAVAAMVVAAHFGTSYSVLLVFAASFPVLFAFGADARHRDGVDGLDVRDAAGDRLDRHPARPRGLPPRPARATAPRC